MEKKEIAKYIDRGFGFPVVIEDVTLVKIRGNWIPKIDYNVLEKVVLCRLARMDGRLTGSQVRFIRLHFGMTLENFAKRLKVSHPAILKWEKRKDKVTDMSWTTEKDIRLFVIKSIDQNPKSFVKLYELLEGMDNEKPVKVILEAGKLAA